MAQDHDFTLTNSSNVQLINRSQSLRSILSHEGYVMSSEKVVCGNDLHTKPSLALADA